jgi:hypothetical protein
MAFKLGPLSPKAVALIGIALALYPALVAVDALIHVLTSARPTDPWESAMLTEGWRAAHGRPVYQAPAAGHATLMYGFAEPYLLGALMRVFGFSKQVAEMLSLTSTAAICAMGISIIRPFLPLRYIVLFCLGFVSIDNQVSYYATTRPDLIAWFLGLAGIIICYRGTLLSLTLGAALIVFAVSFKQTAAALVWFPRSWR